MYARRWRRAVVGAVAVALALLFAGCGGSDVPPEQVISDALGGEGEEIVSGVLEIAASVDTNGEEDGSVRLDVAGPFDATNPDRLPSADLDVKADVESGGGSFGLEGGLTITPDGLYIGLSGEEYELDPAAFARLERSYARAAERSERGEGSQANALARLGLDPKEWVTDLSDEGTTEIDGEEFLHVSGEVDVPALVADLSALAARAGDAADRQAVQALGDLRETIESASIDVYASEGEHQLRRVDLRVTIVDPRAGEVAVGLELGIADPGSTQVITAPSGARPLSELLAQLPGGADALGRLGIGSGGLGQGGRGG